MMGQLIGRTHRVRLGADYPRLVRVTTFTTDRNGIESNPHSPSQIRGTVPEMNMAPFYTAFSVKEGDKMYIAPAKRVAIW
jgi:predicted metalloendopeptidase